MMYTLVYPGCMTCVGLDHYPDSHDPRVGDLLLLIRNPDNHHNKMRSKSKRIMSIGGIMSGGARQQFCLPDIDSGFVADYDLSLNFNKVKRGGQPLLLYGSLCYHNGLH